MSSVNVHTQCKAEDSFVRNIFKPNIYVLLWWRMHESNAVLRNMHVDDKFIMIIIVIVIVIVIVIIIIIIIIIIITFITIIKLRTSMINGCSWLLGCPQRWDALKSSSRHKSSSQAFLN